MRIRTTAVYCVFVIALLLDMSVTVVHGQNVKRPLKIFLLAGQSNMQGQGVVDYDHPQHYNGGKGNLAWSMRHSESRDRMQHLRADGEWAIRDDVFVRYRTEEQLKVGPLGVGFTGYSGKHHMGLELQFGHVLGDHFQEPVLLIKTCWGGKSLYKDFRPPSAEGETGEYYLKMMSEFREALGKLDEEFPEQTADGYEIAGFVWMQGWNDMVDKDATAEYDTNLVCLVQDVRKELGLPQLPVVIGELGNGGATKPDSSMQRFRDAQKAGAKRISNAHFVETQGFARPAELSPNTTHGHHWYGNAESYFLIGDALGESMKALLTDS